MKPGGAEPRPTTSAVRGEDSLGRQQVRLHVGGGDKAVGRLQLHGLVNDEDDPFGDVTARLPGGLARAAPHAVASSFAVRAPERRDAGYHGEEHRPSEYMSTEDGLIQDSRSSGAW